MGFFRGGGADCAVFSAAEAAWLVSKGGTAHGVIPGWKYSAIETKLIWLKNSIAAGKLDCAISSSWGRGERLRSSTDWHPDDLGAKGPVVGNYLGA